MLSTVLNYGGHSACAAVSCSSSSWAIARPASGCSWRWASSVAGSGAGRKDEVTAGVFVAGRKDEDRTAEGQDPASGLTPGAAAGSDTAPNLGPGSGPHSSDATGGDMGQAEGGTSAGIAGAWRGMTSSFSVGADDMAGDSAAGTVEDDVSMKVSPDDGLPPGPDENSGPAAAAHTAGFGQQRDPQAQDGATAAEDLAQQARQSATDDGSDSSKAGKPWGS